MLVSIGYTPIFEVGLLCTGSCPVTNNLCFSMFLVCLCDYQFLVCSKEQEKEIEKNKTLKPHKTLTQLWWCAHNSHRNFIYLFQKKGQALEFVETMHIELIKLSLFAINIIPNEK